MLETELKELALGEGSIKAGIARREAFSEAPPSADMRYLQPWANAVVSFAVTIGGREYSYNKKHADLRCVIGCGGYTGISKNGKWSSWSTGRIILPDEDEKLPEILAQLRNDPANVTSNRNIAFGKRGILDRPRENVKVTCNNCMTVCSGPLETRKKWMNLLFDSGAVELDEEGREVVIELDEQGNRTVRKAATEVI